MYKRQADSSVTGTEQVSSRAEEAITGAIMYVTDANPMLATFVTGHDEANVAVFNDLLRKNGYNLGEVNTFTAVSYTHLFPLPG